MVWAVDGHLRRTGGSLIDGCHGLIDRLRSTIQCQHNFQYERGEVPWKVQGFTYSGGLQYERCFPLDSP